MHASSNIPATGRLLVLSRRTDGHLAFFAQCGDTWYRIPASSLGYRVRSSRLQPGSPPAGSFTLWPSLPDADLWDVVQITGEVA